jgi:hypothetical protein
MELFKELKEVLQNFDIDGTLISVSPYGFGHINTTYLAVYENGDKPKRYILQKINTSLFKSVDELMSNIVLVTDFNRERIIARGGNPDRESLTVIKTKAGENYYRREDGECFRVFIFIENTVAYQTVTKPKDFYYSAIAFGSFSNLLAEFDASKLYEILPNFHNTKVRYQNFLAALEKDEFDRAKDCQKEIEFIKAREHYYSKIVDLLESGKMPLKVTHNDTKLNNVLLDDKTGEPVAVIDLDTIMPGSIAYDFGDAIRFIANTLLEDDPNYDGVLLDESKHEAFTKGFITQVKGSLTEIEKQTMNLGVFTMTVELAIRFLTDYVSGENYFKIKYPEHNLVRTRNQIALAEDIIRKEKNLDDIISKYL